VPETASTALPAAAPPAQADPQPQAASAPPAATRAAPSSPAFAPPAPPAVVAEEAPPTVEKRWIQTGRGRASVALATVAALLLGSAAVTGSLALVDRGAYNDSCDAHFCNHLLYERMHGLAIGTDVLIGVGAATALAAILIGVSK
jgi:hypothetical protein